MAEVILINPEVLRHFSRIIPGCPLMAENASEYALDMRFWTEAIMADPELFFNANPLFAPMADVVVADMARMQGHDALSRTARGYVFNPQCPRCKQPQFQRFILTLCPRIQLKFMACWEDPARIGQLRSDLSEFVLGHYAEKVGDRPVVYNAYLRNSVRQKCIVHTPAAKRMIAEGASDAAGSTFLVR